MRRYTYQFVVSVVLVSLLIAAIYPAWSVSASPLLAPTIAPTKTDAILGDDGDGKADPGEIIEYTVTIPNSGTDATGVTFTDIIDANTTLVGGSVNVSPLAINDSYETIGNTLLEVGVTASSDPAVRVSGSLFGNDIEFLGESGTFNITSRTGPSNGSLVAFNNDSGTFSYLPNPGFSGIDTFTYTLTDSGGLTDTATVTINVTTQRVWYVRNNAGAGGLGRSTDPFDTLVEAQTASAANDTIYVFHGSGTTAGQSAGMTLKSGQRLLGEGVALTVPVSVNGGANPTTLRAAGSMPLIENTAGNGVSVTNISNVEIRGLNIGGSNSAVDITTTGANSGGFELGNNIISSSGTEGIDINGAGTGTLTVNIHDNTITATGNGIDIQRTAGSINVTAFDDNVVHGNTGGIGINIVGTGATILFDANPSTASFDVVSGGNTSIGQAGNGVGAAGLVLDNVRGDLSFSDLDIYATGNALFVDGTTSNYTGTSGTRVAANSGTPVLESTSGAAASIAQANINLVLSSLTSTNSTGTGVSLAETSGTFSAPTGSSITNATGVDFSVNASGGSQATANVAVTYGGTITDDVGTLVQIQNVTASSTHNFTGAINDGNDGDGSGISLTGNSGAAITFSGGLLLSTGANAAFAATGGGAVNVCDESPCNPSATGTLVNTITTTTGTALNVANTSIGANDLEFRSISANGAANGIVLNTTGNSGGLSVKGTGAADSGGIIQNTTGAGIVATNTQDLSLTSMKILNAATHGIDATNLRGTALVSNSVIQDWASATGNGINLVNNNTNLTLLTVSATTFNGTASNNDGIFMEAQGTSSMALSVENSSVFTDMFGDGVQVNGITGSTGTVAVTVKNSSFTNAAALGNGGISLNPFGAVTFSATIDNNTFDTIMRPVTNLGAIGGTNGLTANATLKIKNNTLNNIVGSRGISFASDGSGLTLLLIDNNSINRLGSTSKYAIQVNMIGAAGVSSPGNVTITNNQIGQAANLWTSGNGTAEAIYLLTQNSSTMSSLVSGNVVTANASLEVIRARAIGTSQQNVTYTSNIVTDSVGAHTGELAARTEVSAALCMNASGNILPGGGTGVILLNETAGTMNITQASSAALTSANSNATVTTFGTPTFGQPACATPPAIALSPNETRFANHESKMVANNTAQTTDSDLALAEEFAGQDTSIALERAATRSAANLGSGKPLFRSTPLKPELSGETVNVVIGTLPAGESVTIKFRVTVNGAGTTQISNQGTVTGSNFSDVLTDDPAVGGASDPTITPVDRPDTTVISINRAASSPTNTASVSWTVTFADAVSVLTSDNFAVVNSGLGGTPAITGVAPVGAAPSAQWTVTASTGTGSGTLGLNLVSDTGLSHDVTSLPFTGQVYSFDRTLPTVTNVTSSSNTGCLSDSGTEYCNESDIVNIQIVFSEAVTVDTTGGTPTLMLEAGATDQTATYTSGSGTSTLTFQYTVQAGDLSPDLDYIGSSALALNGGVIADGAANSAALTLPTPGAAGSLGANTTIVVDTAAPTVSYFHRRNPVTSPTSSDTLQFEVDFSERIGGPGSIGAGDFNVTGTTATIFNIGVVDVSNGTYYVDVSGGDLADLNGAVGLDFSQTMSITDRAGNPVANTEPSDDETYLVDNAIPTVTIDQSGGQTDPTGSSPINFTVTFSEAVTGFETGDADLSASTAPGTLTGTITGGPTTYNIAVSGMTGSGTVVATIPAGVASDGIHSNTASTSTDNTVTFDNSAPTVTIDQAVGQPDPASSGPINFTVTFSEAVSGFTAGDVELSASTAPGTLTGTVTGGPITYNVAVSGMTGDGTIVASIPAGAATDGINPNSASTSADNSVLYDTSSPSVTINQAAGQPDPTNGSPINFTVVFSEAVTGFETGDVTLSSPFGLLTGTVTGGPTVYNVAVTGMTGTGTITASIAAGVANDTASKPNAASTSTDNTVTYDATAPTVTINQTAGQADPTSASPVSFEVIFSEPVSGFGDQASDITLSGTAGATTAVVTGGPTTYNVAVSGMTSSGTVVASIPAAAAQDGAANDTAASTSTDNTVSYILDNTPPVVTAVLLADPDPTSASSVDFTVTFSKAVTGVDEADFALTTIGVTGVSVSSVTGSGSTYTVSVSTGSGNGTIRLDVLDDDTIRDAANNRLGGTGIGNGDYTGGETYTVVRTNADTVGVFRPRVATMYLRNSNTSGFADITVPYGLPGDYPIVGDWDGDGTTTIGLYRNGTFYLRNSNTIGFANVIFAFGLPGDQPIVGDWDGNGVDTIGVYRNGIFYLRNSNSSGAPDAIFALGNPGDVGIAGDWDGNGVDTTGVFRPGNGALYLKNTNVTGFADIEINYGLPGDQPVTGDWDNDGVDTIGIYRNGTFHLRNSNTIGVADIMFAFGIPGDIPIAGNWEALP